MQDENLKPKIEAILFAAGEPVSIDKIAKFLKAKESDVTKEIDDLKKSYQDRQSGLDVLTKGSEVQLVSAKEHGELVVKFLNKEISQDLSTAAAEVLSVVAYRGPLTRAQIEQIRGVNCSFTLRNLAMRGLVERKDNPADSRSYLYEISFDFLKRLGLARIEDLPDYQQLHEAKIATEEAVPTQASEQAGGGKEAAKDGDLSG